MSDPEQIAADALAAERDALAAQLEAVKVLHSKTVTYAHTQPNATSPLVLCHACGRAAPCPTLAALLPSEPQPAEGTTKRRYFDDAPIDHD